MRKMFSENQIKNLIGVPTPSADDSGKVVSVDENGKYQLTEASGGVVIYKHSFSISLADTSIIFTNSGGTITTTQTSGSSSSQNFIVYSLNGDKYTTTTNIANDEKIIKMCLKVSNEYIDLNISRNTTAGATSYDYLSITNANERVLHSTTISSYINITDVVTEL